MKLAARVLLAAAAALAGIAGAQESPSDVTDGEIQKYKALVQKGCREPGLARGDPQEYVDRFCNCVLATLEQNLKRAEWQQLYFYSFKQQNEDQEKMILAPHVKGLAVCKGK